MKSLGHRIHELREEQDFSLRDLAKKLDVSPAHLSDIENDRRFPSPALLKEIAQRLRADVDELKKLDVRPSMADFKRLVRNETATWGIALRQLADKKVTPDQIIEMAKKKKNEEKG